MLLEFAESIASRLRRPFIVKYGQGELRQILQVDIPRYVGDVWKDRYPLDCGELRKTNRPGWPIKAAKQSNILRLAK